MSFKAKNLTYEMEEPAFLRRLREGQSGIERQERYIAPRNKKRSTDDEDAPTYVMEGGNETITHEEFRAMNSKSSGEETNLDATITKDDSSKEGEVGAELPPSASDSAIPARAKEKILEVGSKQVKRKAVKMIGAAEDDTEETQEQNPITDRKKRITDKTKSKRKIKLSFQDDEKD